MQHTPSSLKASLAALVLATVAVAVPSAPARAAAAPIANDGDTAQPAFARLQPLPEAGTFVVEYVDGKSTCRAASELELAELLRPAPESDLRVITPARKDANGLSIVLRATSQLDRYPEAKQVFIDAAAEWEELITSPITVVINVDYGPERFGTPYPSPNILGSTSSQVVGEIGNYDAIRSALIARASNQTEAQLYKALPTGSLPTDDGAVTSVFSPSPVMRALGQLPPEANPESEGSLGSPPSIGFNSSFTFDFDPNNGITPGTFNFYHVAVHEIGHALGFTSLVGYGEISSQFPGGVSVWDLFRFRPGTTAATFGTAQRVTKSGGSQVSWTGVSDTGLSTGRPDGSGGDRWQASHWRERGLNGSFIGIMDPAVTPGIRDQVTDADRRALDFMGYSRGGGVAPVFSTLAANLEGNTLTLSGSGTDGDGNVNGAVVTFCDANGAAVGAPVRIAVDTDFANSFEFTAELTGLDARLAATQIDVVLLDGNGNQSASKNAGFGGAESGGPSISGGKFNLAKGKLSFKGTGFAGTPRLEVNGVIVAPASIKSNPGGTKLTVKGAAASIGFRSGINRVRIVNGDLHSNIVFVTQ